MSQNPYVRLRELTGLGQREFERKYGLSHTTMTHVETGQFAELSDRMIISLGKECHEKGVDARAILEFEYSSDRLQEAYHKWQREARVENGPKLDVAPRDGSTDASPMQLFISDTTGSAQGFSKTLKVPSATVMRYATGKTANMPKVLYDALEEVGYPYLSDLADKQDAWRTA